MERPGLGLALGSILLALVGCSAPQPPGSSKADDVAPIQTRTRETTLASPWVDGGGSAPGLGTSEPTR